MGSARKTFARLRFYESYFRAVVRGLALVALVHPVQAIVQTITGEVLGSGHPVAGAIVRIQGAEFSTLSDEHGRFKLSVPTSITDRYVTAGKVGYYTNRVRLVAVDQHVVINLQEIPNQDNKDYQWQDPTPDVKSQDNCGNCHSRIYGEWSNDAHSRSAVNPILRTMYEGTDMLGRPRGPGYRLDWSDEGNCASCHAPIAALRLNMNLNELQGVDRTGVSCDLCHKVKDVGPDLNVPNLAEVNFMRPPKGSKLIFGPFDDATFISEVPDFSHSPLFKSSRFCAVCHDGSFWGVPVYETFTEWQNSQYNKLGIQCQACHMQSTGEFNIFADKEHGGKTRLPADIASHRMMGEKPEELLRSAVAMETSATIKDQLLVVTVKITNVGAGHDVPTGQPMRNLILVIACEDGSARPLRFMTGESVPAWGGNLAAEPGKGFAKILLTLNEYPKSSHISSDQALAEFPSPFWRRNRILVDNRIPPKGTDESTFSFSVPKEFSQLRVKAQLIYRRAFKPLADFKGWNLPDITLAMNEFKIDKP
jgi:hypothetical protein